MIHFPELDLAWRWLGILALVSTTFFALYLLPLSLFRGWSGHLQYALAKVSALSLLTLAALSGFLLWSLDQELATQCFSHFSVKTEDFLLTRWLTIFWLGGMVLFLFRDLLLYQWQKRRLQTMQTEIRGQALLVNAELPPHLFGFLKPMILIPQFIVQNKNLFSSVFHHELVHLENHDNWWNLGFLLLKRVLWFHPLVYLFDDKRQQSMELATDQMAMQKGEISRFNYARALLEVAEKRWSAPLWSCGMNGHGSVAQLRARLLHLRQTESPAFSPFRAGILLTLFLGAWGIGLSQSFALIHWGLTKKNEIPEMCLQVRQERVMQSWLHTVVTPETNKCEPEISR